MGDESSLWQWEAYKSARRHVKRLIKGRTIPKTNEIVTHICSCLNFFPLSSVQIIIIPACCLLCVL